MNKFVFIFFLKYLFPVLSFSQTNYVFNGDFELFDTCPDNVVQVERSLGWKKPTLATSDYFNSCAPLSSGASLPSGNFAGFQEAQSGNAYMGFIGYSMIYPLGFEPYLWVEYIQGSLTEVLDKNSIYKVEYYLNLGNYSNIANKNIGVFISNFSPSNNYSLPFNYLPQVSTNSYITDTLGWTKVSGYFIPNGDENNITIGCFYINNFIDTLVIENNDPPFLSSYYLIDNISITKEDFKIPNVITMNNDGINDFVDFNSFPKDLKFQIINRWGNKVFETSVNNFIWEPKNEVEGVYFYVIENEEKTILKTGFIQLI